MRYRFTFFSLLLLLLSFTSFAQQTTSEILGKIVDEKGEPLPGAVIVAVHQPTGSRYGTTSRADGNYNLPNVKIGGPYKVTVTYIGYDTVKQDGISLVLGQGFTADFKMEIAKNQTLKEVVLSLIHI